MSLSLIFEQSSDFVTGICLLEATLSFSIKGLWAMEESLIEKSVDIDEISEDKVLSSSITFDLTSCSSFDSKPWKEE